MADGKFYIIDLKNDLPIAVLLLVILFSFIGGFYSSIFRPVYYTTSLISLVFVYYLVFQNSIVKYRINPWIFYTIYLAGSITIFLVLFHTIVNTYHVYLLFAIGLFLLFNQYLIPRKSLIRITNLSFLIYLFFSILLYLGVINIGRELNIFDVSYNILGIKTFIGLFGSTASIDSYATIMIFINFYYNKSRNRWALIFISTIAALLTFRTTPLLVFLGPFIIVKFINLFKKNQLIIFLIVSGIFLMSFIPMIVLQITGNDKYIMMINFLLTGRASLWILMLEKYLSFPLYDLLLGFGDTIYFEVLVWGKVTANPHNMYLKFLIVYGIILFIATIFIVSTKMRKNSTIQLYILFAILLAGVGNSNIFSFMNVPISIWFIVLLSPARKKF